MYIYPYTYIYIYTDIPVFFQLCHVVVPRGIPSARQVMADLGIRTLGNPFEARGWLVHCFFFPNGKRGIRWGKYTLW